MFLHNYVTKTSEWWPLFEVNKIYDMAGRNLDAIILTTGKIG